MSLKLLIRKYNIYFPISKDLYKLEDFSFPFFLLKIVAEHEIASFYPKLRSNFYCYEKKFCLCSPK